jgi:flagellar basal-body rod protein FlgB
MDSRSLTAVKTALDGLALREQMISRNIANVDTPGYQAQNVSFENAVKTALKKAEAPALTTTNIGHMQVGLPATTMTATDRPGGTQRADQNDVDIDAEMTEMNETVIRYQALTQMISRKFSLIKAIVQSR